MVHGDRIWQFVDEDHKMLAGFDQFRVRSTSLCVRALEMWAGENDCGELTKAIEPSTFTDGLDRPGYQAMEEESTTN